MNLFIDFKINQNFNAKKVIVYFKLKKYPCLKEKEFEKGCENPIVDLIKTRQINSKKQKQQNISKYIMELTEGDSDIANDFNLKNAQGVNTPKQVATVYEQTQKQQTSYQKTEKTIGTKQFKQANTLWTNPMNINDENLPDLMQDSEDVGTQAQTNSNLNNINNRINTIERGGIAQQNQQRNQQQFYVSNSSLQTGQFRQLIPYNGSSLMNVMPQTASFSPNDDNNYSGHHQYQKSRYSDDQVILYNEGITGRMPAKVRCKNCDQLVQTIVKFEPGQSTSICSLVLCLLTCTLCCFPYLLDQCKDAVHYCPNCGFVIGVKKF
ncbi:LITAF-like zinc ribbon domain protein (macronuclear) [Tetrahymena thermophila SB210]|uniref:LITAF-like zinc ribbon domain protein n=1 Tax=Tetrahymena thermophila (strain SB210) TaxID=312017 RepID=I7M633_TETTS|nr:LITAF-like zinc ribbon domain protein [Tetrahymena thermophila SB210]EAR84119.3 LITAF-like zinc ribbon domain protein [Tetrahymena thermophila SB210]|eukprot:XP_001031782.3 LITAF-like zinc ribbon domain protein [Tetrahymena thermophila SB210]